MTYVDDPADESRRDDGSASTYSESKPATCEEEVDCRACKAFFKTSPALEGLTLDLQFADDRSSDSGQITMIRFSGSGAEQSKSKILLDEVQGTLADQ